MVRKEDFSLSFCMKVVPNKGAEREGGDEIDHNTLTGGSDVPLQFSVSDERKEAGREKGRGASLVRAEEEKEKKGYGRGPYSGRWVVEGNYFIPTLD